MFASAAGFRITTIDPLRTASPRAGKWPALTLLVIALTVMAMPGQDVFAQRCSERFVTLSSQAEVDGFQASYGPCDSAGGLIVRGNDVTNLEGLAGLTSISEHLVINNNPQLVNLRGLRNLRSISDWLELADNAILMDVDGLQGLEHLEEVTIIRNGALASLNGWPGAVASMNGLWIEDNASLVDLGALGALRQLDSLGIIMNNALTNLDGLDGLQSIVRDGLYVRYNDSLVSIDALSSVHTIRNIVSIEGNDLLANLEGLSGLTDTDEINIRANPLLADMDGLRNLRTAKWFEFSLNDALENLDGLSGVTELNILSLNDNPSLRNLDGLSNLEAIHLVLTLGSNVSLENIEGLSNVTGHVDSIGISGSPQLRDIDALSGISSLLYGVYVGQNEGLENVDGLAGVQGIADGGVDLRGNSSLADCAGIRLLVDSIDDFEPGPGPGEQESCVYGSIAGPPDVARCIRLEHNLPGCNGIDEVLFHITSGDEAALRHAVAEANARGSGEQSRVSIRNSGEPFRFLQPAQPGGSGALPALTGSLAVGKAATDDPPVVFLRDAGAAAPLRLFEVIEEGSLTLMDCDVSGFLAPTGGAILKSGNGSLSLERCFFHGNQADTEGGAVAMTGRLRGEILHSRFAGNAASSGCALALTGSEGTEGPFRVTESLFSGICPGQQVHQADGVLSFSGNSFAGAGIATEGTARLLRNAFDDGAGCTASGTGALSSLGWNIAVDGSCELTGGNDQPAVDPMLSPADPQGFMEPLAGSPAVDSGPEGMLSGGEEGGLQLPCHWRDATGLGRPQDGDGDGRFECDAGAVETAGTGRIEAGHSGAFYNSLRNGEGVYVEILENGGAVVYTFSYRPDGSGPAWLLGLADRVGNSLVTTRMVRPEGASFGEAFDSADIQFTDWGGLSVVFPDCTAGDRPGNLVYSGSRAQGYEPLLTRAERISNIAGCGDGGESPAANAGLSGSFYDPARNGEGVIVEWLTDGRVLAIFFTYDPAGGQMWLFGAGQPEGRAVTIDALYPSSSTAWGEAFDPGEIVLSPWGSISLEYSDCDHLTFRYESTVEGYGSAVREYSRLSRLEGLDCPAG